MLEKLFKLKENGTDAKTEIIAGLTTLYTHDWAQVRVGTYELRPLSDDLTHFIGPAKTFLYHGPL